MAKAKPAHRIEWWVRRTRITGRRRYRYRVRSTGNWRTVDSSEQSFADCDYMLDRVREKWPKAEVREIDPPQ